MKLKTERVSLADDITVVVCEADASFDARLRQATRDAESVEGEPAFVLFSRMFYPLMSSCTKDAPGAEESYKLEWSLLDKWYRSVWKLNPSVLGKFRKPKSKVVKFRDGSELTIQESQDYPSFLLRLIELEQESDAVKDTPADEISFRNYVYPKIAACVVGDKKAPPVDDVLKNYPRSEIEKWTQAAIDLNKNWFDLVYQAADRLAEAEEEQKKKEKS
jgi:hypothetical protein